MDKKLIASVALLAFTVGSIGGFVLGRGNDDSVLNRAASITLERQAHTESVRQMLKESEEAQKQAEQVISAALGEKVSFR